MREIVLPYIARYGQCNADGSNDEPVLEFNIAKWLKWAV